MVGPRRIAEKKVAYSSSVHTEGSLPNDTEYDVGKPVTLAKNTGNLVKPGYRLIGWSDGINLYSLGATVTFYMNTDTLDAVWKAGYTIPIMVTAIPAERLRLNPTYMIRSRP